MLSRPSALLRPPPTASRPSRHFPGSPVIGGHRFPGRSPGAEEALSSSHGNRVTVPRPIRRRVPRHALQDPTCRPWPSPSKVRARHPLGPLTRVSVTTPQASLHAADRPLARPLAGTLLLRFDGGLSPDAGSRATGDPGVSPGRTRTGWLPSACRSVTSQQPPCCHGAQAPGRTP